MQDYDVGLSETDRDEYAAWQQHVEAEDHRQERDAAWWRLYAGQEQE